jgi:hypothetical protein
VCVCVCVCVRACVRACACVRVGTPVCMRLSRRRRSRRSRRRDDEDEENEEEIGVICTLVARSILDCHAAAALSMAPLLLLRCSTCWCAALHRAKHCAGKSLPPCPHPAPPCPALSANLLRHLVTSPPCHVPTVYGVGCNRRERGRERLWFKV